jgi:hypothetical protein
MEVLKMIGMKVRYEISDVTLKISNVTLPKAEDSYVLLTALDEHRNEVVFALTHAQAEHLENELYEANRRWKISASAQPAAEHGERPAGAEPNMADYEEPFTH